MDRNLEGLTGVEFDLAVIGGGVNGAATAREAALRGLKVALVEARDFASGTSSRSSKLIHGGLRYLAQHEFRLVREARRERRLLFRLAPHLVQTLPFLMPVYQGDPYSPLKIRAGLSLYDWLGNLGREDRHRFYSPSETLRRVPALKGEKLRGGAVYHDSLTDDARLTLEYVLDAAAHGAVVANYAEIHGFSLAGGNAKVKSAAVRDHLTGRNYEVAARLWVNAAGPWVDRVRELIPRHDGSRSIRTTKGVHLIVPSVSGQFALFGAIPWDGRIFLLMPWHGCSLLGTTDTDYEGAPEGAEPDEADVEYLLLAVNRILRAPLARQSVTASFAGLRALAPETGKAPSANTREYRFHRDPWAANVITVCGGKLTTARALAEKLVDLVCAELGIVGPEAGLSAATPLPGGRMAPGAGFAGFVTTACEEAVREFNIPLGTAERVVRTYGSRWRKALEPVPGDRSFAQPLPGTPDLLASEVIFSIREEMAVRVEDFLVRRSGLNWAVCAFPQATAAIAEVFGREFGWSAEKRQAAALQSECVIHKCQKVAADS
ncbi:MAG: FAD-dependent oxidoreductase [Candidatus Acidiferrales bacterium]